MEKILVQQFNTYGKQDDGELAEEFVITDTPENRQDVIDDIYFDDAYDSVEDFVTCKIDSFVYSCHGGDWDDPTGGYIIVWSYDELVRTIKNDASKRLREVDRKFGIRKGD